MPVHTSKEYDLVSQQQNKIIDKVKERLPIVKSIEKIKEALSLIFVLIHPENGVDSKQNFEDKVTIDGEQYTRKCVNGAVRTSSIKLKNYLVSREYILIDTIEQGETNGQKIFF